tara:strand:+ start:5594 stop:6835 length:1242 start_codon:yes stop_codon:yes gene_type:complete
MTTAFDWIFTETASSRAVSSVDGASGSTYTRVYIFKEDPDEGVSPTATAEDAIRALTELPSSPPLPYQLNLRVGEEITDSKWWAAGCSSSYEGPGPIVTSIDARPLAAPFTFEVTVRAEVFWPVQDSADDSCYFGQYRRFSSASGTRSLKLYRVRDITLKDDTTTDPDEYDVTHVPQSDPLSGHGSGAGFNWSSWIPFEVFNAGASDEQKIYGQGNGHWLTYDGNDPGADSVGGTADPNKWKGIDAAGAAISLPIPQRTYSINCVIDSSMDAPYLADRCVNTRSAWPMFGCPAGTIKFDGVNVTPLNPKWSRADFRFTYDALAFMQQIPARGSGGGFYFEPNPDDNILHAYCKWFQPYPFVMNLTGYRGYPSPTATRYDPFSMIGTTEGGTTWGNYDLALDLRAWVYSKGIGS